MPKLKLTGDKPTIETTDTSTGSTITIQNTGEKLTITKSIEVQDAGPTLSMTDTNTGTTASLTYNGTDIEVDKDVRNTEAGASLLSHADRHNRGGQDAIDWSSISKYKTVTGVTAPAGPSGSPRITSINTLDSGFHNMIPLTIKITPSGLASGETLTITVIGKDASRTNHVLATKTGVSSTTTITIADLDFTAFAASRMTELLVSIESSATSTTATCTVDSSVLET